MDYLKFVRNLIFDLEGSDLSASSEEEEYEKERLLTQTPSRRWRTTGCAAEFIDFDFGAAVEINSVAIIAHNLTSGATITLKADDNSSFSSPEEVSLAWNESKIVQFFTSKTFRYWRLYIEDATNPDGYIEAGNIVLGAAIELCAQLPRGWELTRVNPSVITEAAGGQEYTREKQEYFRASITFSETNPLCADDYAAIKSFLEDGGGKQAFLLSLKQGSNLYDFSFYGRLENYGAFKEFTPAGYRTWSIEFREAL